MPKSNKAADLLKVLGRKTPTAPRPVVQKTTAPTRRTAQRSPINRPPKREGPTIRGKGVQLWLHDEDHKLIREIAVWLLPHRRRINDSLVVRTVLRAAKTGPELLAAYDAAIKVDGRSRQNPSKRTRDIHEV